MGEMVFDDMLSKIVGGQLHHWSPGVTDKEAPEQVYQYRDSPDSTPPAGAVLLYRSLPESSGVDADSVGPPRSESCSTADSERQASRYSAPKRYCRANPLGS